MDEQDKAREALSRILAHPSFRRSEKLSRLLKFVVDRKLRGAPDEDFKEYVIGTEVFERPADFDPRTDNLVRSHAHRLRQALSDYYSTDGISDEIVIEIPLGAYVPQFRPPSPKAAFAVAESSLALPTLFVRLKPFGRYAFAALLFTVIGAMSGMWLTLRDTPPAFPMEVSITPPTGLLLDLGSGIGALSPDAHNYVFPATNTEGKRQLWLRTLSSSEVRPLSGTEDATFPFWAPDGKQVAYFAHKRLNRVGVPDGPAVAICDAPLGRGGTWNSANRIVFAGQTAGALAVVSSDGGTVMPATKLDPKRIATSHRWPVFLPDGNRFLYFARGAGEGSGIWSGSLDGRPGRLLLPQLEISSPSVISAGGRCWLLNTEAGRLTARRMNEKSLEFDGPTEVLSSGIPYPPSTGNVFSVAGTAAMVYFQGASVVTQPVKISRDGKVESTTWEAGDYGGVRLSRDGRWIAYERLDSALGTTDIWSIELDRNAKVRISSEPSTESSPVWSPDRHQMIYGVQRKTGTELYLADLDDREKSYELTGQVRSGTGPEDWSLDGRLLIVVQDDPQTLLNLWLVELSQTTPRRILNWTPIAVEKGNERQARFSPLTNMIAYAADISGRDEIYIRLLSGNRVSTRRWQVSTSGGSFPAWDFSSKELLYLGPDGLLYAVPIAIQGDEVRAGTPKALFRMRGLSSSPRQYPYDVTLDGWVIVNRPVLFQNQSIPLRLNFLSSLPR